jgi:hypothetical protein
LSKNASLKKTFECCTCLQWENPKHGFMTGINKAIASFVNYFQSAKENFAQLGKTHLVLFLVYAMEIVL